MKKIFFVGMPASGKTTIGKAVAQQLNMKFLDLDFIIEQKSNSTIAELFENEGELKFREIESKCLLELTESSEGFVLATGGGTPCFSNNMELMNKSGQTVFLDVSNHELKTRILAQQKSRPLFFNSDLDSGLEKLKLERSKFYSKAKLKVSSDNADISLILEKLKTDPDS